MKHTNEKTFSVTHNGETYFVHAYTYRSGYKTYESVLCRDLNLRGSYYYENRPWQEFTYSSALWELCKRVRKHHGNELADAFVAQTLEAEKARIEGRCKAVEQNFMSAFNNASDKTKEMLKKSEITMNSVEDVESVTTMINGLNALEKLIG